MFQKENLSKKIFINTKARLKALSYDTPKWSTALETGKLQTITVLDNKFFEAWMRFCSIPGP